MHPYILSMLSTNLQTPTNTDRVADIQNWPTPPNALSQHELVCRYHPQLRHEQANHTGNRFLPSSPEHGTFGNPIQSNPPSHGLISPPNAYLSADSTDWPHSRLVSHVSRRQILKGMSKEDLRMWKPKHCRIAWPDGRSVIHGVVFSEAGLT